MEEIAKSWHLEYKSVFERLRIKKFEDDEMYEAIDHLLLDSEKEFLSDLYPLGLDSTESIYQFALLNDPVSENYNASYWELAQKILSGYSHVISNYKLDQNGSVHSLNGKQLLENEQEKIACILYLNKLCKKYGKYYHHYTLNFNYHKAQMLINNAMRRIIGERALSKIPKNRLSFIPETHKDAKRLNNLIVLISNLIRSCRKGEKIIRFDAKTGTKYLKEYNPDPFLRASRSRSQLLESTRVYLLQNKPFPVNSKTAVLFRKLVCDSAFMGFIRRQSKCFQSEEKLNPYTLIQIWIDRENRSLLKKVGERGICLETMVGVLKESFSETIQEYESTKLRLYLQNYTPHRPETIRYLASKVKPVTYSPSSFQEMSNVSPFDKMFTLLNVMDPRMLERLPYFEREFVILRFGLRGKVYSCETISKILHVDLNLVKNYYAKYLKLIFQAMERYAHAYMDMEAQAKVVLK